MSVRTCERCGAALPAGPPGTTILCGYCGAENTAPLAKGVVQLGNVQVRMPEHAMTVEEIEEGFREKARDEKDRLRTARIMAAVFAGVFLVVLGVVLLIAR